MADTISTYSPSTSAAAIIRSIRTPSAAAASALSASNEQFVKGLGNLVGAGAKLAQTWNEILEERDTRDMQTEMLNTLRNRRIEYLARKGKATDGLLEDESKWLQESKGEILGKYRYAGRAASELYDKLGATYLNSAGTYMMEQQAQYDKSSRKANSAALIDNLVNTPLGDLRPLQDVFNAHSQLFANDPATGEAQDNQAIQTQITYWARTNPQATIAWFKQNKEQIAQLAGRKFVNVSNVIESAEKHLLTEARRVEAQARAAEAYTNRQIALEDARNTSKIVSTLIENGGYVDSATMDAYYSSTAKASSKISVFNFQKGLMAADAKRKTDEEAVMAGKYETNLVQVASEFGGDSTEFQQAVMTYGSNGLLDTKALNRVLSFANATTKTPEEAKQFRTAFVKFATNYYTGNGQNILANDPQAAFKLSVIIQGADAEFKRTKDIGVFDINNPDSFVRKAMATNPRVGGLSQMSEIPGMPATLLGGSKLEPGDTIQLPSSRGAAIPVAKPAAKPATESTMASNPIISNMLKAGIKPKEQR